MEKRELIKAAEILQQVSGKSAYEFESKVSLLVEQMNKRMENRKDLIKIVGEGKVELIKDNNADHAEFLKSIFNHLSPEMFVDRILWAFRAYRSQDSGSTYWTAQLNTWMEIYQKELTPECYTEISAYYNWMQTNVPMLSSMAEENLKTPHLFN